MHQKFIATAIACACYLGVAAQDLEFNIGFGLHFPQHTDLKTTFELGGSVDLGIIIPISIKEQHFFLRPCIGGQLYSRQEEKVNDVTENLTVFKLGGEIQYQLWRIKGIDVRPTLSVQRNSIKNNFTSSSYDPFSNSSDTETSDNLLTAVGPSFELGILLGGEKGYVKLGYEYLKPTFNVNQEILNYAQAEGLYINPHPRLNLSTVTITIGFKNMFY